MAAETAGAQKMLLSDGRPHRHAPVARLVLVLVLMLLDLLLRLEGVGGHPCTRAHAPVALVQDAGITVKGDRF